MVVFGDSISNKNTNSVAQSSMYWGIIRTWAPNVWRGICTPTNSHLTLQAIYPNAAYASAIVRNLQNPANRQFSYGYERIASSAALDIMWSPGVDMPSGINIIGSRLNLGGEWGAGDWFSGVPLSASLVYFRTPHTVAWVRPESRRGSGGFVPGAALDPSGPDGVATIAFPDLPPTAMEANVRLATEGTYDESAREDHLIWLTTRLFRPDVEGFQLDSLAVGGAKLADFLADGFHATDEHLGAYLHATGDPNLIYIQLGANDGHFVAPWPDHLVEFIERIESLSRSNGVAPLYLLVTPYGTRESPIGPSITQAAALAAGQILYRIARDGTPSVHPDRIAFINTPELLGGAIDPHWLVDAIHPTPEGADFIQSLIWSAINTGPAHDICPADWTGSSDPMDRFFGIPDGVVDVEDFGYFLNLFAAGDPRADLTDRPADPLSDRAVPRVVDADDFFAYLDLFAQGCPRQ